MTRTELDALPRDTLIAKATEIGVPAAKNLTRPELVDEILLRSKHPDRQAIKIARGLFGVARDLLSRVVERGLHLPDAAERTIGSVPPPQPRAGFEPIPTVTLASIYESQGQTEKAVSALKRLLETDPEHPEAKEMLARLTKAEYVAPPKILAEEDDSTGSAESDESREDSPIAQESFTLAAEGIWVVPWKNDTILVIWKLPSGRKSMVARLVEVRPGIEETREREVALSAEMGTLTISVAQGSIVRAALVGKSDQASVSPLLVSSKDASAYRGLSVWTPDGNRSFRDEEKAAYEAGIRFAEVAGEAVASIESYPIYKTSSG